MFKCQMQQREYLVNVPNMVNSANKESPEPASMDNVPKLPPLACAQSYSENPYEIDLSFRSLDIIAFKEQQRRRRNQGYKSNFQSYAEWEKNFPYNMSVSESSESDDSDSDDKKDNKLQDQIQKTTQLVFVEKDGKAVAQLKAPINSLFPRELGPQQAARWPADIQVIDRRIKHIPYVPNEPEAFYKVSGLEKTPMVRGEDRGGRLVFMYEPRSTFFVRSRVGGIRTGPEQCAVSIDRSQDDTTLIFESRFESGNLAKAIQVGEYEYELWLRYDLYTNKHTQWFYFSISNTRPNVNYRFSIVNFMKPDSLYNYGMKPLMYSEKDALQKKVGWHRCGNSIKYYRNNIKYETSRGDKPFYSLTWNTEVPHKGDTVYFSHCFPYTYTDLQDYLLEFSNDPIKSKICKQRVLCRTLAGNLVYLLTITSPSTNPEDIRHKKAVVLTARVHPGESNSSWMMKGFLDYLTSNTADAKLLRDTFIFKIVPMLNPDGVIVGNYRCSLAGRDLNRNYKTVLKDAYPTVWHTKQMIRRLLQEREIVAYCDLHGHSRRQNVFIYGCENRHQPDKRLRERIFPCMLHKNSPDKFHFDSCKFKVQKSKEGTGRIVMWNMGILNSYTMEATFCGSTLGKKKGFHFTTRDYEQMGYDFCDTLLDYCDPDATKCANVLYDLEENLKREIRKKLEQKGVNLENVDLSDDLSSYEFESSDGGSDSSVSDGPPVHLQFQPQREDKGTAMEAPKKKKKLKSKKERDRVREGTKDATKKSGDKQASGEDSNSQRKPLSGHQTSHAKQEKLNAQVRYIQGSPKRPKSHDERAQNDAREAHSGVSGRRESTEEHQQKRPRKLLEPAKCDAEDTQALAVSNNCTTNSTTTLPTNTNSPSTMTGGNFFQAIGLQKAIDQPFLYRVTSMTASSRPKTSPVKIRLAKIGLQGPPGVLTIKGIKNKITAFSNEYLENLTAAYLRKGIIQNQQEQAARRLQGKAPAHLRYSGTAGKPPSMPFSLEGLCPHHEQAFAAQLMAQQLQNMTGAHSSQPTNWLKTGIQGQPKSIRPFEQKTQDEILTRILGMPSVVGNSFVRVWKDYLQKHRGQPPKLQRFSPVIGSFQNVTWREMNMDELMGSGVMSSHSSAQTERRSSRHHLIEVSESQKRQELLQAQSLPLRKPERSASRHGKDDKDQLGGLSSRLRAQIPSATFVNYETFNISQMNLENDGNTQDTAKTEESNGKGSLENVEKWLQTKSLHYPKHEIAEESASKDSQASHHKGHKHTGHSGRKSRMGMHDSDDEETKKEGPDYVHDPHSHRGPRVKSAKSGGEEFNSAIQSIKDLRQSLTLSAANSNLSPTAGNYIKKLLKQEMKQTDDDIEDITAKLQLNIDEKQKQYEEMVHTRDPKNTALSPVPRENSIARSAPVSTSKDKSNNNKAGKSEQNGSAHVKSKADKKEKKTDKQESLNQKLSKSVTNLNGLQTDGVNSRLVDVYQLPDNAPQTLKQEGFKGGKLDTDGKAYLSKLAKLEYMANGKSDVNYSSATDLASLANGTSGGRGLGGSKRRQTGIPRSASSSSSKEESWNERTELYDKEKSELLSNQRVKSAKNPSRQVVETIPTKISLMITQDLEEARYSGGHFLPMSRTVRGPFNKSAQPQPKRK